MWHKTAKLTGEAVSTGCSKIVQKCLLNVVQERDYVKEQEHRKGDEGEMKDTMRDKMIELVDKAKEEYANDVTDHSETEYIVEGLLNYGIVLDHPTEKGGVEE